MPNTTHVLVFGVFDHLHDGHRFFLEQAHSLGETLVITVARDTSVATYKGRAPEQNEEVRMQILQKEYPEAIVTLGDEVRGSWSSVIKYKPACIALGYDQVELANKLSEIVDTFPFPCEIVVLPSHRGGELHSSILRKQRM